MPNGLYTGVTLRFADSQSGFVITLLQEDTPFPPVEHALRNPNGLLAAGGGLAPARLLDAYRHGIFPWFNEEDPVLWWCPDPRMVLFPSEFRISRSLRKTLCKHAYEIRVDTAFEQVMLDCAAPRGGQAGTWIHEEMITAYTELHRMGYAHSVETWIDGRLAGGLYGVALGGAFFGESMFSRVSEASKVAFAYLVERLRRRGYILLDTQFINDHVRQFGAIEVSRTRYLEMLVRALDVHTSLDSGDKSDAL